MTQQTNTALLWLAASALVVGLAVVVALAIGAREDFAASTAVERLPPSSRGREGPLVPGDGIAEVERQDAAEQAADPSPSIVDEPVAARRISRSTLLNDPATSEGARTIIFGQPCVVSWNGTTRVITYEAGGVCSEVQFEGKNRHGLDRCWHPSGQLRWRGYWYDNAREGRWEHFNDQGVAVKVGDYSATKKSGQWTTRWDDNSVKSIGSYVNGSREGEWLYFLPRGGVDEQQSGWYENNSKIKQDQ